MLMYSVLSHVFCVAISFECHGERAFFSIFFVNVLLVYVCSCVSFVFFWSFYSLFMSCELLVFGRSHESGSG